MERAFKKRKHYTIHQGGNRKSKLLKYVGFIYYYSNYGARELEHKIACKNSIKETRKTHSQTTRSRRIQPCRLSSKRSKSNWSKSKEGGMRREHDGKYLYSLFFCSTTRLVSFLSVLCSLYIYYTKSCKNCRTEKTSPTCVFAPFYQVQDNVGPCYCWLFRK